MMSNTSLSSTQQNLHSYTHICPMTSSILSVSQSWVSEPSWQLCCKEKQPKHLDTNIETVSCPCMHLVTYFLPPALERIKNTYCMGKRLFLFLLLIYMRFLMIFYAKSMGLYCGIRHWASLPMGRVLNFCQTAFQFWVIFCHITLECSWVIGFCLHFSWMYVATGIAYSEPRLS